MKNYRVVVAIAIILLFGCKENKKEKSDANISAISIIKGQLNKLDSSMFAFMKLERNGNRMDTTFLTRNEIRSLAEPFLSSPDITDKENQKNYSEERLIDAQQGTLSITSTLVDGKNGEIQKQILVVGLEDETGGKVQSIFIDRLINIADSTIEQKLFWQIDKFFTIGRIVTKESQPERTYYTKVEWQ